MTDPADTPPASPKAPRVASPPVVDFGAPDIFVKGGTTTSAWDNQLAQQRADTEARRAHQDAEYAQSKATPHEARMQSMKLGGSQSSAMAVLALKHAKDNIFLDWIICEVIDQGDELALNMACPRCHAKNPGHEPDMLIRQSNRSWWLDPKPPKWMREVGSDRVWVNPKDGSTYVVAGSVHTQDWIKCTGLGCTWTFKIDDSVVHTKT